MYRIKNFKRLTEKGEYFKLAVKDNKVVVKRNLLETMLNIDYTVELPNLYSRIKNFKSNKNNYIELKIEGVLDYFSNVKDENLNENLISCNIEELICVNICECYVEECKLANGMFDIVHKNYIGKYVVTQEGEFVLSKRKISSNPTIEEILKNIIINIAEGKIDVEILNKLPLNDWNKELQKNGESLADFIATLYLKLETDEANKFNNSIAKQALLDTRDFNLNRIEEILSDNAILEN